LQAAEVHTSHLGGYLTPDDDEWESCACSTAMTDLLLIFPMTANRLGRNTRAPERKEKSKRERLLNFNSARRNENPLKNEHGPTNQPLFRILTG
jgi:hypothetical protein